MKNIINKLVFGSLTVALSSCIGNYENKEIDELVSYTYHEGMTETR